MSAWIEIKECVDEYEMPAVALYMSAWIEISRFIFDAQYASTSHST